MAKNSILLSRILSVRVVDTAELRADRNLKSLYWKGRYFEFLTVQQKGQTVICVANGEKSLSDPIHRDSVWGQRRELDQYFNMARESTVDYEALDSARRQEFVLKIVTEANRRKLGTFSTENDVRREFFRNSQNIFERNVREILDGKRAYSTSDYSTSGAMGAAYSHLDHFSWIYATELKQLQDILKQNPEKSVLVMDLGTGNGHFILTAAAILSPGDLRRIRFIGLDKKDTDMRFAREILPNSHPGLNVEWKISDIDDPSYVNELKHMKNGEPVCLLVASHVLEYLQRGPFDSILEFLGISENLVVSVPLLDKLSEHVRQFSVADLCGIGEEIHLRDSSISVDTQFAPGGMLLLHRGPAFDAPEIWIGHLRRQSSVTEYDPTIGERRLAQVHHVISPVILADNPKAIINQLRVINRLKRYLPSVEFGIPIVAADQGLVEILQSALSHKQIAWIGTNGGFREKLLLANREAKKQSADITWVLNSSLKYDPSLLSQHLKMLLSYRNVTLISSRLTTSGYPEDAVFFTDSFLWQEEGNPLPRIGPYIVFGNKIPGPVKISRDREWASAQEAATTRGGEYIRLSTPTRSEDLPENSTVVVLEPHPDDLILSGSTLMKRLLSRGNKIVVLGIESEEPSSNERREQENRQALDELYRLAASQTPQDSPYKIIPILYSPLRFGMTNRGKYACWDNGQIIGGSVISDKATEDEKQILLDELLKYGPDLVILPAAADNHSAHVQIHHLGTGTTKRYSEISKRDVRIFQLAFLSAEFSRVNANLCVIPSLQDEEDRRHLSSFYLSQLTSRSFDGRYRESKYKDIPKVLTQSDHQDGDQSSIVPLVWVELIREDAIIGARP